jgi:hypothetical protein
MELKGKLYSEMERKGKEAAMSQFKVLPLQVILKAAFPAATWSTWPCELTFYY